MRLLFANPHPYLPDSTSGRDISIHEQVQRWRARGIDVAVFAARNSRDTVFRRDDALGYPIYRAAQPAAVFGAVLADWKPEIAIYPFGALSRPLVALGLQAGIKAALLVSNIEASGLDVSPLARSDIALIANSQFAARRIETLLGVRPPVVLPLIEPERYAVPSATGDAVVSGKASSCSSAWRKRGPTSRFLRWRAGRSAMPGAPC
jgi:hypothetical protein